MFIKFNNINLNMNLTPEFLKVSWVQWLQKQYLNKISVSIDSFFQSISVTFFVMIIFVK